MKHIYLIAALALPLSSQAMAQSVEELAREYVELPDVAIAVEDLFSPKSMAANFEAGLPATIELSDEKRDRIGVVMSTAMMELRPRLEEEMVAGMVANFSADEVQALIDFYGSKHGASVMRKMQPYMTQVMGRLAPEMDATQKKMIPQIVRIMQE